MIFMQGKRVGHINLSTGIRDLCYTEGVGGVSKKCGSRIFLIKQRT